MNRLPRLSLLPILLGIAWRVVAQLPAPAEELSLSRAIEIGLQNNFQIKIAENNMAIARQNNTWGNAGALPNVNANLNLNNGYNKLNNPASFLRELSTGNTGIIPNVDANWLLYSGGRVRLTKEQLADLERRSEGQGRVVVENAVQAIILAYYRVQLGREQLQVLEEVLKLSRDRIEFEQVKREFGQASTFDILQTRDAYLNDSTTYIAQLTTYQSALHTLNQAMGVPILGQRYVLTDSLAFDLPDYDLDNLRQRLLANNNQLNNLAIDRELSQVNSQLLETNRLPELRVNTGLSYNFSNTLWGTGTRADGSVLELGGVQNKTLNGFINFAATYNIYNGGVRSRNIQNAKIQELNAQYSIEDARLNLMTQLENLYVAFNNQKELVTITTDLLDNARRNLEIAEDRFRGGLINSFDYRTIQLQYINASQARLQAFYNVKQTETELRRLVGDLVL